MHDEEENARTFHERVVAAVDGLGPDFEIVLVDDGSRDGTARILAELAESDARVKVVWLSRNFGHQAALTAGLEHASGDVVVMMDADLQDPPEVIPALFERWQEGGDVVYAVRDSREGETRVKLWTAHVFYRMMAKMSPVELPVDAGDFRLMDRRALDAMLVMPERNRFLRGMSVWVGFNQTAVRYQRDARTAGRTKFTLGRMIRFSLDAVSSFSHAPLQAATLLGFVFASLAFLAMPLTILARIYDIFDAGIPTVITLVLLIGGIQLITVGLIGEYVGRIYDEVKRRPLYIVADRANLPDDLADTEHPDRVPLPSE